MDIDDFDRRVRRQRPAQRMQDAAQIVTRFLGAAPDGDFHFATREDALRLLQQHLDQADGLGRQSQRFAVEGDGLRRRIECQRAEEQTFRRRPPAGAAQQGLQAGLRC